MRRSVSRLLKKIPIWIKRNLQGIGVLFSFAAPVFCILAGLVTAYSMLLLGSLLLGWGLIAADVIIRNRDNIFGMPIPPKRFTSLKGECVIIKKEELHEIAMYLYSLEEYLEEAGKTDGNEVKK